VWWWGGGAGGRWDFTLRIHIFMNSSLLKIAIIWTLIMASTKLCFGQIDTSLCYISFLDDHKSRIINDHKNHLQFVLDTSHIYIEAIDENGNRLWKTDPWTDAKLPVYRFIKRPKILTFCLCNDSRTNNKDEIGITYQNSQFGYVDLKTGKFRFAGQF
jgi:hypothetical protein